MGLWEQVRLGARKEVVTIGGSEFGRDVVSLRGSEFGTEGRNESWREGVLDGMRPGLKSPGGIPGLQVWDWEERRKSGIDWDWERLSPGVS